MSSERLDNEARIHARACAELDAICGGERITLMDARIDSYKIGYRNGRFEGRIAEAEARGYQRAIEKLKEQGTNRNRSAVYWSEWLEKEGNK